MALAILLLRLPKMRSSSAGVIVFHYRVLALNAKLGQFVHPLDHIIIIYNIFHYNAVHKVMRVPASRVYYIVKFEL
jgi:hypothetical protein